ncbi:hypothetical protein OEZ85_008530 [Tetradesmus obliquus]|uniref:RING-type domain-containing protein n=1 Tax=Tetradesmus obliquus TaxID=3088 RepID=A0ABY8TJ35_TETOB|nr:hypothetical protein OEZ85_008530 [Tetradesmus obliquus]
MLCFLAFDSSFRSWGDVYFFCGPQMQYCTCGFRWNLAGWSKAFILWNFVLSAALGVQRLIIQLGLCGLLPGEEVVTRESFISICWRLIPYWLNNWEQQWGAECSSMMFELPHFAVELVIILPCVQILCSRMKVLAMPSVNAALPPRRDGRPQLVREEYVPNVLRGCWERQPAQRHIWQRIRANRRIIAFSCLLCGMALANALLIPLHLEGRILQHPDTALMAAAGRVPADWRDASSLQELQQSLRNGSVTLGKELEVQQAAAGSAGSGGSNSTASKHVAAAAAAELGSWGTDKVWAADAVGRLAERVTLYQGEARGCPDVERLRRNLLKHHGEIARMQEPQHRATIPLVEMALALMRLSTEKFFVLLSLYVAFLLFRVPPRAAAALVALNARASSAFARLILYSFPAVCWVYGAGFTFSTFVSVVFWGGPIMQAYDLLRTSVRSVSIKALRPATAAEIERMHGDCAICCHAYHQQCLNQWLQQCHSSGATASCPMCQTPLQLSVQWNLLPWRWRRQPALAAPGGAAAAGLGAALGAAAAAGAGGVAAGDAANNYLLLHQPRLALLLADMPQILAPEAVQILAEVQVRGWR